MFAFASHVRPSPILKHLSRCASSLRQSPIADIHAKYNGKFIDFAGWEMPVLYAGMSHVQSHKWTRENASLFDVSLMQQVMVSGRDAAKFVEEICVADVEALGENCGSYSLITNTDGGIIDDTVLVKIKSEENSNPSEVNRDGVFMVLNAACAEKDLLHLNKQLEQFRRSGNDADLDVISNRALLALQGPKSAQVLQENLSNLDLSTLFFMQSAMDEIQGVPVRVTRCGYTGEDGFEISVPSDSASSISEIFLSHQLVKLSGLAARDSLRLEAGLCLYGNDLDENTSPVEAVLMWTISKRRRSSASFLGAEQILSQFKNKTAPKRRIGLLQTSRGVSMRAGSLILDSSTGEPCGCVTSGSPSPSLGKNIAMGYVNNEKDKISPGAVLQVEVGGKRRVEAEVVKMPFVATKYYLMGK